MLKASRVLTFTSTSPIGCVLTSSSAWSLTDSSTSISLFSLSLPLSSSSPVIGSHLHFTNTSSTSIPFASFFNFFSASSSAASAPPLLTSNWQAKVFPHECNDMVEAMWMVCVARVLIQDVTKGVDHGVIGGCIVTDDTQTLDWHVISEHCCTLLKITSILTLSDVLKPSRIFANAAMILRLQYHKATSTKSMKMHMGSPLFSKCTVMAINALWLGEVHMSVAKLSSPSCSLLLLLFLDRNYCARGTLPMLHIKTKG